MGSLELIVVLGEVTSICLINQSSGASLDRTDPVCQVQLRPSDILLLTHSALFHAATVMQN